MNAELDRVKTGHAIDPVCREVPPTLRRDPRTGELRVTSRCPPHARPRSLALFRLVLGCLGVGPEDEAAVDIIDRREVDHAQRPRLDLAGGGAEERVDLDDEL